MSRLQELVAELCPDGVEYKAIKDVYRRLKGTPITAAKMKQIASDDGEITVFAGGKTKIQAHEKDIPNANITRVPALLVQSRGVIDFVYCDTPFTFKNEMWAYTADDTVSIRYLMYCLKNNAETFRAAASGMGSLPQISLKVTENYRIPIPPVEVQREIVRILDEYTTAHDELVRKLEEEMVLREQELSIARNEMCMKEEWPLEAIGNVFTTITGGTPKKSNTDYYGANHPFYKPGDLVHGTVVSSAEDGLTDEGLASTRSVPPSSILMTCIGSIGKAAMVSVLGSCNQQINAVLPRDGVNMSFYLHVLCSNYFQKQVMTRGSFGNMPILSRGKFDKLLVPVPPLDVQDKVASVLDGLSGAINESLSLLREELSIQEQSLSGVRNELLSFPEKVA